MPTKGALESATLAAQQTLSRSKEAAEYSAQLRTLLEHLGGLEVQQIDAHSVQLLMTTVVPPAGVEAAAEEVWDPESFPIWL